MVAVVASDEVLHDGAGLEEGDGRPIGEGIGEGRDTPIGVQGEEPGLLLDVGFEVDFVDFVGEAGGC